jgi:hypothetical protein
MLETALVIIAVFFIYIALVVRSLFWRPDIEEGEEYPGSK